MDLRHHHFVDSLLEHSFSLSDVVSVDRLIKSGDSWSWDEIAGSHNLDLSAP
jgi:hypothetical protein